MKASVLRAPDQTPRHDIRIHACHAIELQATAKTTGGRPRDHPLRTTGDKLRLAVLGGQVRALSDLQISVASCVRGCALLGMACCKQTFQLANIDDD